MGEDEWITDAMKDDRLVAELLMRLRHTEEHASLPTKRPVAVFPKWGFRQPRTRQILRCHNVQPKKEDESRRASPTTPLSWSGATTSLSGSGAVDGYEESSHIVKRTSGVRSKVISTSVIAAGRRSRKKKTFAELKEEESLLLKESIHLKKALITLRTNFEEQRARNETFKRMKLDLQLQSEKVAISVELKDADCQVPDQTEANLVDHSHSVFPKHGAFDERDAVACPTPGSDSCRIEKKDALKTNNFFALPDLNLPLEEDLNSELINGIS
ncbi:uncharacterized protein LOC122073098 [Macadamia integrifolia]|uniref:uncharacterized protein LOC122073098 n=1 Tax=Macadamia integrifolia TaxID=60698 RepID=UPI001C4E617C|nr:uncharacterized protein LOC122073098 [Macadamia integrifolia]